MVAATPALAAPIVSSDTSSTVPANQVAAGVTTSASGTLTINLDGKSQQFRDEFAKRQAKLEDLKAQLDQLDREAEIASESQNQAQERLDQLKSQLATSQVDLANADNAYRVQEDLLAKRAAEIYSNGDDTTLEVVLGSKSLPDFLQRLEFLGVIGQADADLAVQLQQQRDSLKTTADDLALQQQQAEALQFDLQARGIELKQRIADRQAMLAGAQSDLLGMLDAEAARRAKDEAALFQNIVKGVTDQGVVVTPGSPVETALAYHGIPYVWGGATPAGFDCSGLVLYVFAQHGVTLPHYSGSQFLLGQKVDKSQLLPGDVVFFGSPIHHVGIYIGGGYVEHAPHTGDFVKISTLDSIAGYAGARRYAWQPRLGPIAGLDQISPNVNHGSGVQGIYGGTTAH
jgi:cell wall-associated NlpC family hydrolase